MHYKCTKAYIFLWGKTDKNSNFMETVVCTAVWLNDSMLNSYSGWNPYNKPQAILCTF